MKGVENLEPFSLFDTKGLSGVSTKVRTNIQAVDWRQQGRAKKYTLARNDGTKGKVFV